MEAVRATSDGLVGLFSDSFWTIDVVSGDMWRKGVCRLLQSGWQVGAGSQAGVPQRRALMSALLTDVCASK